MFDNSDVWKALGKYKRILNSWQGRDWIQLFKENQQVGCNLLVDVQDIFNLYFDIGNHVEYRDAIIAGNPIHPQTYQHANQHVNHIINNLSNILSRLHTAGYCNRPRCASFFQNTTPNNDKASSSANNNTAKNNRNQDNANGNRQNTKTPATSKNVSFGTPPGNDRQAKQNSDETKGFLVFTSADKLPRCDIFVKKDGKSTAERLCFHYICKKFFCKRGGKCNFTHVQTYGHLQPEIQKGVTQWVNHTLNLSFVPGKRPNGKNWNKHRVPEPIID
jgi:hypothetical protein